jgi:hypothetical protein
MTGPKVGSNSNLLLAFYNEDKYLTGGMYKGLYARLVNYDRSYICLSVSETREKLFKNFKSMDDLELKLKLKEIEIKNAEIERNNLRNNTIIN